MWFFKITKGQRNIGHEGVKRRVEKNTNWKHLAISIACSCYLFDWNIKLKKKSDSLVVSNQVLEIP